ncbi:lytic transglycosylase domain-containing protein [Aquihabitans sp. G128]|uniref:lytic murein transglycosylase n=1 Tax=Aquihabitans sp. G128 TaxID=2849779 RepID=UPI001C24CE2F|nr:lytic murein transglycosylase [Aquihabitans sp. G128]QXC60817.1 lytic transglycosylase domain-containing protein [Aquihabitans sp. G128]
MNGRNERRRGAPATALALAAALVAGAVGGAPAGASPARSTPAERLGQASPGLADAKLIDVEGVDPVLDEVSVQTTPAVRRADDRLLDAQLAQGEAARKAAEADQAQVAVATKAASAGSALVTAQAALDRAEAEVQRQELELAARQKVTDRRRKELDGQQAILREMAVAMFTSKPRDEMTGLGTFDQMSTGIRRDAVRNSVAEDQSTVVDQAERVWRTARGASRAQQRRVDRAGAARKARAGDVADATELRDHLQAFLAKAADRSAARHADFDRATDRQRDALLDRRTARLLAQVDGTDLTLVDLHAYWRAAAVAPCDIPWWVLAGVGKVETRHGTAQGSTVGADGTTSVRILGIPLDGRPGVALVGDSDGGTLDGTAAYDRAVGPMQFIPSTWSRWAVDANGDGKEDPHNLYDAAGAAANYLCFGRGALTNEAVQRQALLSYNHSIPYGTIVLGDGRGYQKALPELPELPPADQGLPVPE